MRQQPLELQLDELTKQFIWHQLLECTRQTHLMSFYLLPEPRKDTKSLQPSSTLGREAFMEYHNPFPYRPVNSGEETVKGSCSTYALRRDVTADILQHNMTLNGIVERSVLLLLLCMIPTCWPQLHSQYMDACNSVTLHEYSCR